MLIRPEKQKSPYTKSNGFQAMLMTFLIILYVVVGTIFFGFLTIFVSFMTRSGTLPHLVARMWGRSIISASRVKVKVIGLDNIDPNKPYVYMPNHVSNFDIPVILGYLPVQFRWLAKSELFKIPLFGFAMRRAGYISIDRSNRRAAFKSLQKAAEAIKNGASVVIFPEGTRSRDGKLHDFKKGGFVMALKAGVPIVPVTLQGTYEIMSKDGWRIQPGQVTIQIKPPIASDTYSLKSKEDLMGAVREAIRTDSKNEGNTPS